MFWDSILTKLGLKKTRRRASKHRRLGLEILEDRLAPASISQSNTFITITLNTANEDFHIHATSANHYALTTSPTANFTGSVTAPNSFSGFGAASGTLVTSGITQINIVATTVSGASITFDDSAAAYAEAMRPAMTNASSGPIQFNGTSTFDAGLSALNTNNNIVINSGATLNLHGFNDSLQANGATAAIHLDGSLSADSTSLLIIAGQNITQGQGGVIKTADTTRTVFSLNAAQGDILLGNRFNDLAGSVTFGQANSGSVRDVSFCNINPAAQLPSISGLTLHDYSLRFDNTDIRLPAGLSVSGNLNVSAGSGISEAGPITATGGFFTVLANGSIRLDTAAGNNISGSVSFDNHSSDNTTTVAYTGVTSVNIGTSPLGLGAFTVKALNGNITVGGTIVQRRGAGAVNFIVAGAGNTVTLTNVNDLEGAVTIGGPVTTVNFLNQSTLAAVPTLPASVASLTLNFPEAPAVLPNLNLANLTVDAQGIYQTAGSAIVVSGNADLDPTGKALLLTNAGNDFTNIVLGSSGPNPTAIKDANAINFGFGSSDLGIAFTLTAGGAITQSTRIRQRAAGGRISLTAGTGTAITLDQSNDIHGVVSFHTTGAGGNVTVGNFLTPLTLGTSNIGGNLTVNSIVKQDPVSTLTVGGNTIFGAGNGNSALDNLGNVFIGSVALRGSNASVSAKQPLVLGASSVIHTLTVHAGGAITQSGAISAGDALFDAGSAAITLTNSQNNFGTVSAISTGAAPVTITDADFVSIDRLKLGRGALTITAATRISQFNGSITQSAATPMTFDASSVTLQAPDNKFLGAISLPHSVNNLNITNQGDISFVGTPAISGLVQLKSGGTLTLPPVPLSLEQFSINGRSVIVSQNLALTAAGHGGDFIGAVTFSPGITLDAPDAFLSFLGDVNPAGALTLNLGATGAATFVNGTWNQGANPLTINGSGVFNIGRASFSSFLSTFSMTSGTIAMPGSANIVVNKNGTFKVGRTSNAETVTVDSNAGNITFMPLSTLSVGLGTVSDKLIKATGDTGKIFIHDGARLTSYAGIAGAAISFVLAAPGGIDTSNGFFNLTVDPLNGNAPHAFLMGTDIVQPIYGLTDLAIMSGGTVAASGVASGFEADSDKFTLRAVRTGTTTSVPLAFVENVNHQIDVVVRNAAFATTLTVTTTKSFGDGNTQLGGIAMNGPGAAVINAATSNANADILVAGPLSALTLRNYFGSNGGLTVIRAGGTSSGVTAITGRFFSGISIDLPTVLSSLAVNTFTQASNDQLSFITAERFGTIKTTPVPAAGLSGDFLVSRLTNLNRANSTLPAITSVTVGGTLGGSSSSTQGVWDIAGNVGAITAATTKNWDLGEGVLSFASNLHNADKLRNVGTLNLGSVTLTNLHAVGKISNIAATNWNGGKLQAGVFGKIKIAGNGTTGNLGEFNGIQLTATTNSGVSTVSGVPSFEALASLSVAGDSDHVTVHLLDGNATSIAVGRFAFGWTIIADVTSRGGAIAKLIAGNWDGLVLDAKTAGTIAAIGNVGGVVAGDIAANIVLHGSPGFTGAALGALKASRDIVDTSVLVENGSITAIVAGCVIMNSNIRAIGSAGAIQSITAAEWFSTDGADDIVARNIGSLTITGAPMTASGFGVLPGNFSEVNVLTFLNAGATPAIATLSVAGDYRFASGGFLRADNGIKTFKVGRKVGLSAISNGGEFVSLLNSSSTSDVPGRIASLTVGQWNDIDIAAKTLGTVKATGFFTPQNPSVGFTPGVFSDCAIGLFGAASAPLVPHVGLDSLTANMLSNVTLAAPFGISSLVAVVIQNSTIDADRPPTGPAGRITLLQASKIDRSFIRAVSVGTLKTVPNVAGELALDFIASDLTVTGFTGSATAPVAVGTISIFGELLFDATFNIPHSITSFAVGKGISTNVEIAAGFALNARIASFSASSVSSLVLTSRAIGAMNVTGDFTGSLVTLTGSLAGVAMGSFTALGQVSSSTFNVTGGNVTSFITAAFEQSRLLVGFQMPKPGDIGVSPFPGSNWLSGSSFTLGTFKTTGLFDPSNIPATASFSDSFVVAQRLGTVSIAGLNPILPASSNSFRFGIAFRASLGSGPVIKVNGVNKSVGFTDGDFVYADLDG